MRVPTVKIKHPKRGTMIVNETDWALGSIPGVDLGSDWTRVGERTGDGDAAVAEAKNQRKIVEAQRVVAERVQKLAKGKETRKATDDKAKAKGEEIAKAAAKKGK